MLSSKFTAVAGAALVLLFAMGIIELFLLRFESGNLYPPYSSLRTDPLGAKALYDSLALQPGYQLDRTYRTPGGTNYNGTTFFYLGANPRALRNTDPEDFKRLDEIARSGGRLVIGFLPEAPMRANQIEKHADPKPSSGVKPKEKDKRPGAQPSRPVANGNPAQFEFPELGFTIQREVLPPAPDDDEAFLFGSVPRETSLFFTHLSPGWTVQRGRLGKPVIIERTVGRGSLVMVADSYLMSNEALSRDRDVRMLGVIVGPNRRVVFDESHLGVRESSGVMQLAKKYRLQGFGAALLLLTGLFFWQSASSFLPPLPRPMDTAGLISGFDASSGLVNLLRRSLPPDQVLKACMEQWRQSLTLGKQVSPERLEAVASLMRLNEFAQDDPAKVYAEITRALAPRK